MKEKIGRTPKGAVRSYDKNGNFIGYVFRNVFAQIEYDLRKQKKTKNNNHYKSRITIL